MPRFENIGHRTRLQQLGVLAPDEVEISPQALVQRILDKPDALEETLYIFRQDILQPITVYGMLDSLMEMTGHEAENIIDKASFDHALRELTHLIQLPRQAEQQALGLRDFAEVFEQQRLIYGIALTTSAQYNLEGLQRGIDKLEAMIAETKPNLDRKVAEIYTLIQQKGQLFSP